MDEALFPSFYPTHAEGSSAGHRRSLQHPRGNYVKTAAKREAIVTAALDVFSTMGYTGGSLKAIAEQAGLTQAGVLHHFPNKQAVLEALLSDCDERWSAETNPDANNKDEVLGSLLTMMACDPELPKLASLYSRLSAEAISPGHPSHAYMCHRNMSVRRAVTQLLCRLQAQGQVDTGSDPRDLSRQLLALAEGFRLQWLLEPGSVDMRHEIRSFLDRISPESRENRSAVAPG